MVRNLFLFPAAYILALDLIAQVPPLDPDWGQFLGNGVTVAVLAFYVVYDLRVRTPAMQATFAASLDAMRSSFQAEQTASRLAFLNEQAAIRAHFDREIGEYRQMLRENMAAMRTAVHDVKDTANVVMTNQNLRAVEQEERDEAREHREQHPRITRP